MWYAVIGKDVPESLALRKQFRPAHLARLQTLNDQGRVLVAGPTPIPTENTDPPTDAGFTGSILIVDFPSLEEAKAWAHEDPYMTGGVFSNVDVTPFMQVLP